MTPSERAAETLFGSVRDWVLDYAANHGMTAPTFDSGQLFDLDREWRSVVFDLRGERFSLEADCSQAHGVDLWFAAGNAKPRPLRIRLANEESDRRASVDTVVYLVGKVAELPQ